MRRINTELFSHSKMEVDNRAIQKDSRYGLRGSHRTDDYDCIHLCIQRIGQLCKKTFQFTTAARICSERVLWENRRVPHRRNQSLRRVRCVHQHASRYGPGRACTGDHGREPGGTEPFDRGLYKLTAAYAKTRRLPFWMAPCFCIYTAARYSSLEPLMTSEKRSFKNSAARLHSTIRPRKISK